MKKITLILLFVICLVVGSFVGNVSAEEKGGPLGYPFSSWGAITASDCDEEDVLKFNGYIEQGIDWFNFNKSRSTFNTFIGLYGVQSDQPYDYWDNKVALFVGVKVKTPLNLGINDWGGIDVGIRGEFYDYTRDNSPISGDTCVVLFVQWSFGGDWKKKK
ncbi:MAG: hypothetical protein E3J47_08190 [Candidatus Stahlbacteria bacterium]|nr:MAG: hypothetical protein E3J47_08190 [Candidatus Stahlbacteria bacterium]